jgi:hypothetical protein
VTGSVGKVFESLKGFHIFFRKKLFTAEGFLFIAGIPLTAVIPAKAGIHVVLALPPKMDSRFRGNDGGARD